MKALDASGWYADLLVEYGKDAVWIGENWTDAQVFGYAQRVPDIRRARAYYIGEQTAVQLAKLLFRAK